ncbi:MAG: hypothetical protein JSS50_04880 [Proteobacteria bacterium]|nr:hypothetical protein [Pseudomonadota bacterium]
MSKARTPPNIQVHVGITLGIIGILTTAAAIIMSVAPAHISGIMLNNVMVADTLWVSGLGAITLSIGLISEPTRCFLQERAPRQYTFAELSKMGLLHNALNVSIVVSISVFLNTAVLLPYMQSISTATQAPWLTAGTCMGIAALTTAIFSIGQCIYYKNSGPSAKKGGTRERVSQADLHQLMHFYGISVTGAALSTGVSALVAPFLINHCCTNPDLSLTTGILATASITILAGLISRYIRDLYLPDTTALAP